MVPQSVGKRASLLVLLSGPLTTLAISPWFNFDPINPIKLLVVSCLVLTAFGLLIPYLHEVIKVVDKPTVIFLTLFTICLLSAFLISDADKYQQFWGVFGRGTGVFSYLILMLLFFLASFFASSEFNKKIVISLLITTVVMVAYCIIQILKLDPIGWSAYFPFGTLGNVNFLSGYLGIALVCVFILILSANQASNFRIFLVVLFLLGLFALYKSDSTQGLVAFAVGSATYLVIKAWWINRTFFAIALSAYISGFIALVAGLFDKGPFREFIFQFTVQFRADYMHAAIEMLTKNPLNGVGIDAYDDWYRSERGTISALRTSLNRTANSAHNIALDLGAGGGFPLLIVYLSIIVLVLISILKGLKNGLVDNPYFMAIAMSWIAYQVQAAVSINQIGVGVWGWLLGGLIVGTVRLGTSEREVTSARKGRVPSIQKAPNTPPPLAVISSVIGLTIGFLATYAPIKTDADYLTATKRGSAELVIDVAQRPSANAFLLSRAVQAASDAGLNDVAREILGTLTDRFPRNLYGQLIKYERFSTSDAERVDILARIQDIDPLVAFCYGPDPQARFRSIIENLNREKSYNLARGWGLVPLALSRDNFTWEKVSQPELVNKLTSFCINS